jgi:hypothetical protein
LPEESPIKLGDEPFINMRITAIFTSWAMSGILGSNEFEVLKEIQLYLQCGSERLISSGRLL